MPLLLIFALRRRQVWDLATLSLRSRLTGHDGAVLALQLIPERDWLVSASGASPSEPEHRVPTLTSRRRRRDCPRMAHPDSVARLPYPPST